MTASSRRRRRWALLAGPIVALGCNGLLGIDDGTYVPLDAASLPKVLEPERAVVRVPIGERRRVAVTVDPGAGVAAVRPDATTLTAAGVVVAVGAIDDEGRCALELSADASIDASVDTTLSLEGLDARGRVIGAGSVRVLVGLPGTRDVSFGDEGMLHVTKLDGRGEPPIGSDAIDVDALFGGSAFPVVTHGSRILVGDGNGALFAIEEDGRVARALATPLPGCTLEKLVRAGERLRFGGSCDGRGYVAEADLDGADPSRLVSDGGTFVDFADERGVWMLDLGGRLHGAKGGSRATLSKYGSALLEADGGLVVIGASDRGPGVTGLTFEIDVFTVDGTGALGTTPRRLLPHPEDSAMRERPIATAVRLGNGGAVINLSVDLSLDSQVDETFRTERWVLAPDAGIAERSSLPEVAIVALTVDGAGRFVTAEDLWNEARGRYELRLQRFAEADGTIDDAFARGANSEAAIVECGYPDITRDEDGMIVVTCSTFDDGSLQVVRVWP